MRSFPPEELYYITHINNLQSILEKGILSHERIEQLELKYTSIYDEEVVNIRKDKLTPDGESLWHFANLYFQPRNSMLFRIIHDSKIREASLVVIGVSKKVLIEHDVLITDGNAANYPTQFIHMPKVSKCSSTSGQLFNVIHGMKVLVPNAK